MATFDKIALYDEVAILSDTDPVSVGTVPAEGTAGEASRQDHVHDLGAGCIDAAALFAAGVVDETALGTGAVTEGKLGALAVTVGKIGADAVDKTKVAADVAGAGITQAAGGELDVNVDDSTVEIDTDTLQVKDSGIAAAKLATDAVETLKIKDLNVTTGKLAADAVDGTKIADDSVGSEHIEPLSAELDFAGQEAKAMVLENLASDPTAVLGKIYFKTGDTHPYICTAV